ncbi:hypothetical protein NC653_028457 [Populus alba x Populus x berolinensis]|uniref:COBRA C-terminal domain-containing protein n=1 Tax=Populus alba x Populus x berolinensis TaxID=444605 RepID=A0AAD6Q246_9ROSI|nr:hypothetical protein NC653_028457 [Populus alba x Populus x berolinensis]
MGDKEPTKAAVSSFQLSVGLLWYFPIQQLQCPEFLFAWSRNQAIRAVQTSIVSLQFSSQVMGSEKTQAIFESLPVHPVLVGARIMKILAVSSDTALLYGNKKNNDKLLEAGLNGNVQSEILLGKDMSRFTLEHGWGFPSRIYFDGDECMMPPPDSYPSLPNSAPFSPTASSTPAIFLILILLAFWCSLF